MTEPVLTTTHEGVATVTLNRPEQMNGLDRPAKELLRDVLAELADDDAVRCVVLTGSGRAFCSGQDLKEHVGLVRDGADAEAALGSTIEAHYSPMVTTLLTMRKPVVAALNGVAAGAGASLALACDVRVMAEGAGINLAFAGIALSCDTGASLTLPRLVGHAKALELLWLPRTLPAAECLELGLANRVVADDELVDHAAELAARLAAGPTVALGAMKASLAHAAEHGLAEALAYERSMMVLTGDTDDHRGAVEAFLEKRKPTFTGR